MRSRLTVKDRLNLAVFGGTGYARSSQNGKENTITVRRYKIEYTIEVPEGSDLDAHDQDGDAFNDLVSEFLSKVKRSCEPQEDW